MGRVVVLQKPNGRVRGFFISDVLRRLAHRLRPTSGAALSRRMLPFTPFPPAPPQPQNQGLKLLVGGTVKTRPAWSRAWEKARERHCLVSGVKHDSGSHGNHRPKARPRRARWACAQQRAELRSGQRRLGVAFGHWPTPPVSSGSWARLRCKCSSTKASPQAI